MFYLKAGIHLHKVKVIFSIQKEFYGARVLVIHSFGRFHCKFTHIISLSICKLRGGCDLNEFLIAPLNRTIPFKKMNHVARAISQNLNFDMLRRYDTFLNKNLRLAKGFCRFRNHSIIISNELFFVITTSNTSSTTTISRFKHDWVTNRRGKFFSFIKTLNIAFTTGNHRYCGCNHCCSCLNLISHLTNNIGIRANKFDISSRTYLG